MIFRKTSHVYLIFVVVIFLNLDALIYSSPWMQICTLVIHSRIRNNLYLTINYSALVN